MGWWVDGYMDRWIDGQIDSWEYVYMSRQMGKFVVRSVYICM